MPVRSWLLPTDPNPVHAVEQGSGAPVVLLHGQPGQGTDWDLVVEAVAGRLRLIVPDRPGYGRTGGSAVGVAANADALIELLDRKHIDHATIVGYSWAGAVALDLAQRHPSRVSALVLVASVGATGSVDDLDRALSAPVIGPVLALGGLTMMQMPVVRHLLVPEAGDRLPRTSLAMWRSFIIEQRAMVAELPTVTAGLATIDVPTVVVIGGGDRVVRPVAQEALATRLLHAEVVRVPAAGHLLPWEAPAAIADAALRVSGPPMSAPGGPVA